MMKKSKMLMLTMAAVFLIGTILAGCGGQKTSTQQPAAGPKYKLKLATQLPESHPIAAAAILYAKKVKEKSNGEIEITVFNNGTLGQERDLVEGMKIGTVDMANVNSALMTSFAPRWQVFSLPYLFQSEEHMYKVVNGPIGQQLFKEIEPSGLKGLAYQWSGFRSITTKKGPVNVPEDLKGLKIRTMPAKTMVDGINAMGGIATPMDQGAVYNALQSGILDGWENNPATVLSFKMNEVCPYFSYTNHFAAPNILLISQKSWAKLSPEAQKVLMEVSAESQKDESEIFQKTEKDVVEKLKAAGMKFNDVNTTPFFERAKPLWKSLEEVVGKDTFDEIEKLRSK
ncbi:TRAP transporter substrate-binding protein [Pelosinus sp. UFO1]|uniref:TRAP transporter substrate-binding protein n=1 Tax=Pelosinus sp. UFO1 TaxID=484770 RepID=UPI000A02F495|nr:TRAP transporter substrate-binding protein [Pelosinus sp. UFO1]